MRKSFSIQTKLIGSAVSIVIFSVVLTLIALFKLNFENNQDFNTEYLEIAAQNIILENKPFLISGDKREVTHKNCRICSKLFGDRYGTVTVNIG